MLFKTGFTFKALDATAQELLDNISHIGILHWARHEHKKWVELLGKTLVFEKVFD